MLVLLSFALVLVATVLLVLGLLNDDGLTLIYISIASSLAAAVVLLVALRLNKPRAAEQSSATGPVPLPEPALVPAAASSRAASEPVTEVAPSQSAGTEWQASDQDSWSSEDAPEEGDEVDFPIADYDTLSVGQILPLLPQLYSDEIDVVEERERKLKARPQVLAKLAELRDDPSATADPLASYIEVPAATSGWDDEEWFPIEDYEALSAAQIRPLLPELDDEELTLVRTRELSLGRRRSLLDEIDRRLGILTKFEPLVPSDPTPKAAVTASPRKAASKKAPAKRAPLVKAVKTPVTRTATPSKKSVPAKKAAVTKAATKAPAPKKAAPAKKVTVAAKAPARKAPAKKATVAAKAPARKAAPAKKAMPTKKTAAAKKATPAKKKATRS